MTLPPTPHKPRSLRESTCIRSSASAPIKRGSQLQHVLATRYPTSRFTTPEMPDLVAAFTNTQTMPDQRSAGKCVRPAGGLLPAMCCFESSCIAQLYPYLQSPRPPPQRRTNRRLQSNQRRRAAQIPKRPDGPKLIRSPTEMTPHPVPKPSPARDSLDTGQGVMGLLYRNTKAKLRLTAQM